RKDSPPRGSRRPGASTFTRNVEPERLQKVLARAGLASRREVEDWIRAGRITVNGEPAVLGGRVGNSDPVRLDGRLMRQRQVSATGRVFLCHRSPGENLQQPVESEDRADTGDSSQYADEENSFADSDR